MKTFTAILAALLFSQIYSQVPYNQNPNWTSTDVVSVSTGGAFADLNRDGWIDFVVANGNDMARQKVAVYYNNGNGTFPAAPNWQSTDIDYHGHLDVGDVNGDGFPDVAVSVYIGPSGFSSPGKIKLYLNNAGTLSSNPVWTSADLFYTFSCAFGDADGDGDLDLAAAGGESYNNNPEQPRIYYNNNGVLETLPSWKGASAQYSYDVDWADFDNDGDLDLVLAGESSPNKIFENINGTISTTPVWQSADISQYANSLYTADFNGDGYLDLAVSDNNQLGGSGKFKLYRSNNGILNTIPYWTSTFSGYGSGIMLADIDNDLDPDLITGGWWQPCRIYLNNNGNFNVTPEYTSTSTSVVEAIVCNDVDKDAVQNVQEFFLGNGQKKLYYMPRKPLLELTRVVVGTDTLQFNEYCYDLENGWVSLSAQPASGVVISIEALVSWDIDMGITNWDNNKGNYIFNNTTPQTNFQLSVNVSPGWNMLSIPGLYPVNQNVNTWWQYRDPDTNVYRMWNGGNQAVSVAAPGIGYWLKHSGGRVYNTGDEWPAEGIKKYPHLPIFCSVGWNLFGGYEQVVNVANITTTPSGLQSASIFTYSGGYFAATTIDPGYGYWIKLTGAGKVNIGAGTAEQPAGQEGSLQFTLPSTEHFGKITITDNLSQTYTLYTVNNEIGNSIDISQFDLPPYPPQGMFDVRYSSQRYAENLSSTSQVIEMMGIQHPVKVKAEGIEILISDETGKDLARLKDGEEAVLNTSVNKLMVSENITPSVYSLAQNFPNPFNPVTTIRFSIPEDVSSVKLIIYNALGEKAAELVNSALQAGTYNYQWNAERFASGIYVCQLVTEKFVSMKKMILLK